MNFFLPGTNGPYTGCTDVQAMYDDLDRQQSGPWRAHAQRWTDAGTALHAASGELRTALNKVTIWQQSTGSEGWTTFKNEVTDGVNFLETWNGQTATVAQRLNRVAEVLDGARGVMRQCLDSWNAGKQKANSSEDPVIRAGMKEMDTAALTASIEMNIMSGMLGIAFDGLQAEFAKHDWTGPVVAKPAAGGPQPQAQDQGAGTGTEQAKSGDAQTKADEKAPDDKTPDEKKPEAKDPVEEAGKLIDVVGKGIDLVGKVPENLDKWITLAQHAKDLVDPGTTATTTTDPTKVLTPDQPALAGGSGTTTAPTFHASASPPPSTSSGMPIGAVGGGGGIGALGNSGLGHVPGTSERTTPVQKSATVAGSAGAEPALSGKTSSAAATSSQQSTPPMYPPQSGGMGAGGNGARDIKPGGGTGRRPAFNVPAEQTETERLRRHGVQSDLQGRSNGESRTAGVPPLRKRKRSAARPAERDVLDEDLWKL